MGWEVDDIDATQVAELERRGVEFEEVDLPGLRTSCGGIADIEGNYPSKGASGERGARFRDSEGNLLGVGEPVAWTRPLRAGFRAPSGLEHVEAVAPDLSSSSSRSAAHSTRSPLTSSPLRLRSSSACRLPSSVRTTSAWRRETVGSSRRRSAAPLRPIRVQPGASLITA